jgi:hypothetical protein
MESSIILGAVGVLVSFMSMVIAGITAKHAVRRDSIHDLSDRIETLEGDLADCHYQHRAAEERNLVLMEHLVRIQIAMGD